MPSLFFYKNEIKRSAINIAQMDFIVTLLGIFYGAALIFTTFVSNKITEALRIDTLILHNKANPGTRILNLLFGIVVLGYCAYSLIK